MRPIPRVVIGVSRGIRGAGEHDKGRIWEWTLERGQRHYKGRDPVESPGPVGTNARPGWRGEAPTGLLTTEPNTLAFKHC